MDLPSEKSYSCRLSQRVKWSNSSSRPVMTIFRLSILCLAITLAGLQPVLGQSPARASPEVLTITEQRNEVLRFGSNASSVVVVEEEKGNPLNLAGMLERLPAVANNGQNGQLQVYSIRGVAGQRVQSRLGNVPINTERRAGTAAAFVDPWLLSQIEVVRGPASTYFGSGAIGGVVQFQPRFFEGLSADVGFETGGTQRAQAVGFGRQDWSLAIANRTAANGEDPQGTPLHTGFEQSALMLQNRHKLNSLQVSSLLLSTRGQGIGRSNTMFPDERIVDTANEDHDLLQLTLNQESWGQLSLYAHHYQSRTDTLIPSQSLIEVGSKARDYGGHWARDWSVGAWSWRLGAEIDARDGVESEEAEYDSLKQLNRYQTNLDAKQRTSAILTTGTFDANGYSLQFGLRQTWVRQTANGTSRRNNDLSGFLGGQWYLDPYWTLSVEFATAYRVPSLSERFFSGTTARGRSIGNPDLTQENANGFDLGLHWRRGRDYFSAHLFRQDFDDYIERINLDSSTRSFENRQRGDIAGLELEGRLQWRQAWRFSYGGHWLEGDGSGGDAIADIPAPALDLGLAYGAGAWELGINWQHRFAKDDVAATELDLDSADLVSAYYQHQIGEQTVFSAYAENVLNQSFRISADEIATLGNRRRIGIRLNHRFF